MGMVAARCRGGENGELAFNGYRVSVQKMKRVLAMDGGEDSTIL